MGQNQDIFDRIMSASFLRSLNPFYTKHKSVLLYLFFGALTTVVSIGSFAGFLLIANPLLANLLSWVAAVTFAYVTNRIWVFSSRAKGKEIFTEAGTFFGGRLFTLVVEEGVLYVGITLLTLHPLTVKISAQIVVLILNYIISKLFVFRK